MPLSARFVRCVSGCALLVACAGAALARQPADLAGTWELSVAATGAKCRIQLLAQRSDKGDYFLGMPAACRQAMPALATVGRWAMADDEHLTLESPIGAALVQLSADDGNFSGLADGVTYGMKPVAIPHTMAGFEPVEVKPPAPPAETGAEQSATSGDAQAETSGDAQAEPAPEAEGSARSLPPSGTAADAQPSASLSPAAVIPAAPATVERKRATAPAIVKVERITAPPPAVPIDGSVPTLPAERLVKPPAPLPVVRQVAGPSAPESVIADAKPAVPQTIVTAAIAPGAALSAPASPRPAVLAPPKASPRIVGAATGPTPRPPVELPPARPMKPVVAMAAPAELHMVASRRGRSDATESVGDLAGRYAVMREKHDTGCMLTLDKSRAKVGERAQLAPGCRDQGIVIFDPSAWQIVKGELVLTARAGHKTRLEKQDDGSWAKDPKEGGKPLGLKRL